MSAFDKVVRAAARLSRSAGAAGTTRVIREALNGAKALADRVPGGEAGPAGPFGMSLPCLGRPSAFDFSKGLQDLHKAAEHLHREARPAAETASDPGFTVRQYSGPAGSRRFKLFKPEGGAPRGLILMLHGCTQNPDDFAAGTRMNVLAQQQNLLVAYPEQPRSANPSGCWNWFDPKDQRRDAGEPAILAGIAREVAAEFGIQPGHTFAAGLSAGGAMAAILAETYPDVFAAVGIHSGLPYGAASDVASAFAAMRGTASSRSGRASPTGPVQRGVPTIVFHGDADGTVHANNADAIVARFTAREAGLRPETERGTIAHTPYSKVTGRDPAGRIRFEHWTLGGVGHAWSGGSQSGSYTAPSGPDASAEMVRFFLQAA